MSVSARLLGLRVRTPPEPWMFVCCDCCVLPGRCLCIGLITCPEDFYRVCVCVIRKRRTRKPRSGIGSKCHRKKIIYSYNLTRTNQQCQSNTTISIDVTLTIIAPNMAFILHYTKLSSSCFNILKTKRNLLYIRNQSVPRSKLFLPRL